MNEWKVGLGNMREESHTNGVRNKWKKEEKRKREKGKKEGKERERKGEKEGKEERKLYRKFLENDLQNFISHNDFEMC